ncbi:MAG TPA: DUF1343 domain-containing protein [Gemmatimonadetes bacterium]|jgi:uncharacterized protein YbbC (DUF1343 family)|nr:DUF1343 domain-containing protein [Gemmatimonadota bacterium]
MNFLKRPQSYLISLFALLVLFMPARPSVQAATQQNYAEIKPGIQVLLEDSLHLVKDKRVGLVTNQTGVDSKGSSSIDLIFSHPQVDLIALFSPEHGIRGDLDPGEEVEDGVDPRTGLPIYSLYGNTRKPTSEMLEDVEVLLVDLQDIGARYWTYISTMTLSMEAAFENGIPVVVLDRPNPIGAAVQGNILYPEFSTFVGRYPIPMRHGMTSGELALYYQGEFNIPGPLHIAPVSGLERNMTFEDTGLPWIKPSPNMPTLESALHYPGTCLFEGTYLSVGRGTDLPFQVVGSPWLNGEDLAERMHQYGFAGVSFKAVTFTPQNPGDGKFDGTEVDGVQLLATSSDYNPTEVAVALLVETYKMSGDKWEWLSSHFDRLAGTDSLRKGIVAGSKAPGLISDWSSQLQRFLSIREQYLIYP